LEKLAATDGSPAPGVLVKMVHPVSGEEVETGQEGEILAQGPECFVGYTNEKLNNEAFQGDWFCTGDLGIMDAEGHITISGRKKDIIIRSGENLSVKEIEDAVHTHPKVNEVAVVGMPDPVTGEKACAFVTLANGVDSLTLDEIKEFLIQKQMAKQKIPEHLEIIGELPKTSTGKIKKNILKEEIAKKMV
jgi:acyl-CoA synthetase (AMP-forming)/AMP-acid ligase II